MSDLRPFRQYDEHDVINLFTSNLTTGTAGVLMTPGKLVKLHTDWLSSNNPADIAGDIGFAGDASLTGKVLSTTWSLTAKVQLAGATDTPLGITLVGMRDEDENGEKLIYNPRKAAEMGVVVPGESIPIMTRGLLLVSSSHATWVPSGGGLVYCGAAGELTTSASGNVVVGTALGAKDADGFALVKIDL